METPTQTVIDALYDLPLGGNWRDVQTALCGFWQASGAQPDANEVKALERHFDRAFAFMERLPPDENRWRHELYRIPVPACVIDRHGAIVEANDTGKPLLDCGPSSAVELHAGSREVLAQALRRLDQEDLVMASVQCAETTTLNIFLSKMPTNLHPHRSLFLGVMIARDLPAHGVEVLISQYKLTGAEADLCMKLASGSSLDEVAAQSELKKTTLRTHLANSFSKLGVNSQPGLVSLVLHTVFAAAHLAPRDSSEPKLTPHLDPEIHGHPRYIKHKLRDGRYIGCFEYGDPEGIPAVYLHGSLGSGLFMKSQKLHQNGVRLFAVERSGVGETSINPDPSPAAYAQDILELVDHLGLREMAVIGRSMGSWDAVALTLAAPERIRLLVLAGGRLPVQQPDQHVYDSFYTSLYNSIWHSDTIGRLMLRMMLLRLMVRGPEQFIGRENPVGVENNLDQDPLYPRHMMANWLRSAEGGPDPVHHHLKLYRDPVPEPPWLNLATPTVLIHGLEDEVVPYQRIIEQTETFTNRSVILLPNVGHRLIQLAMGEVLRTVRDKWPEHAPSNAA